MKTRMYARRLLLALLTCGGLALGGAALADGHKDSMSDQGMMKEDAMSEDKGMMQSDGMSGDKGMMKDNAMSGDGGMMKDDGMSKDKGMMKKEGMAEEGKM